jgi:hypothetical protein
VGCERLTRGFITRRNKRSTLGWSKFYTVVTSYAPPLLPLPSRFRLSLNSEAFSLSSLLSHARLAILLGLIMTTPKDRVGEYKIVPLDEQDAVELRKAVATGSVKEPIVSSASA